MVCTSEPSPWSPNVATTFMVPSSPELKPVLPSGPSTTVMSTVGASATASTNSVSLTGADVTTTGPVADVALSKSDASTSVSAGGVNLTSALTAVPAVA